MLKIDKDLIDPKKEPISEKAHDVINVLITLIPYGDGIVEKLFNKAWKSPAKARLEKWMFMVTDAINEIYKFHQIDLELLLENEKFIDTFIQASIIAIKHHEEEKLLALKNAVLNSAISEFGIPQKEDVFLQIIDLFSIWHFKMLEFYQAPMSFIKSRNFEGEKSEGMFFYLKLAFPLLSGEGDFLKLVFSDLKGKKLIINDSPYELRFTLPEKQGGPIEGISKCTTTLGDELLGFISKR